MPITPDHGKSERVWAITERLAPKVAGDVTWMDEELIHRLLQVFEATRTIMLMRMVQAGLITHEQAQNVTPEQAFLLAFHVGVEVGQEFKAGEDFLAMWQDDKPPDI